MSYQLSRSAAADLIEITVFLSEQNPAAAKRLLERFFQVFQHLAAHPKLGPLVPGADGCLRRFPVRTYVVYYRVFGNDVVIATVRHASRELPDFELLQ